MLHRSATAALTAVLLACAAGEADAAACTTDEFSGAALDDRWSVLRPSAAGPEVAGGALRLALQEGTLQGDAATAQDVVLQDAPAGGWTTTARVALGAIDAPGERAGIVLWRAEGPLANTFMTATFARDGSGAARFEAVATDRSVPATPLSRGALPAPSGLGADVLLRLRSDGAEVTAAYSADEGTTWVAFGEPARIGGHVRIGLLASRPDGVTGGGTVSFDRFTVSCGPEIDLFTVPDRGTAILELIASADLRDDRDDPLSLDVAWDLGDGTTGMGSWTRFHKYLSPGTYRPTLWVTDSDGNVTAASGTLTALATDPPCPAASDEFSGNGLDPKWWTLREVPTGLDVGAGHLWLRPYAGELLGADATARNVVLQPAPAGPWTTTTTIDVSALDVPGDQAGLVLWRGEWPNDVAKLVFERAAPDAYRIVRAATAVGSAADQGNGAAAPGGPVPESVHLRLASDGARPAGYTASYSLDGEVWTPVAGAFGIGGGGLLRLGVAAVGSSVSDAAGFDRVDVAGAEPCGLPDTRPPETAVELEPRAAAGAFQGPVRVSLSAVDDATGSGVARTEYRLGDGAFVPYDTPFTLTGVGQHAIAYRSIDRAGNLEPVQHASVLIADPPSDGGSGPSPGPPDAGAPPPTAPARRAAGKPRVRIVAVRPARVGAGRGGVRVSVACHAVETVRVTLTVRERVVRRLTLGRRTLATRTARCARRVTVLLAPRGRVARALVRARRGFRARLAVHGSGPDGVARDRRRVVLR